MSRRFRICMAKGGRESLRSRYGRSKLTLISRGKKLPKTVSPKTFRPQFSKFSLVLESAVFHIYSEPSGHEDSPGGTQNIPYLFKNLSKSRLSDPFFGLFLVISEVGSQVYIANLGIFKI